VIVGFDFPNTPALGTDERSETIMHDVLLTHILAHTDAADDSFFLQLYHQHGQEQRQLFEKQLKVELVAGSAKAPLFLPTTYFVAGGDVLTVAISNVGKNAGAYVAANIQVALWGVYAKK
jgi:hypothetical protein